MTAAAPRDTVHGDWAEAAQQYQALRQTFPDDRSVIIALADVLRRQFGIEEAGNVLTKGRQEFTDASDFDISLRGEALSVVGVRRESDVLWRPMCGNRAAELG